ncbi:HAMP domain-containing histidine kinase [Flavobacteriaceae bacterium]|nr:HAMP domain-containing histidine kinase [Flavobacteriaceae bacterium]
MLANNQNVFRWVIIISSFFIISLILWNTYDFFQKFKHEERIKMQTWSFAQSDFLKGMDDLDADVSSLTTQVMETNTTTPMIFVDGNGSIFNIRNIDTGSIKNPKIYLSMLKERFEKENIPIEVTYKDTTFGTIVYGNSELLNKLKYYPLALILIIVLFAAVAYFFYRSTKIASQNKLWTGMAKETAHQIGTPLSSLVGWTEILRSENINPDYLREIEKDIDRLQTITDRFSKIGSFPTLNKMDVVFTTSETYEYLKTRFSELIEFEFEAPEDTLYASLNGQLFSWTIENLVKNGIDAMKGKGSLKITIKSSEKYIFIQVADTGKGISKNLFQKIFEPGFTSKKRGWGLGLSLSKRIIEDYHKGKIKVLQSQLNQGTTFQISLKRLATNER